MQGESWYSTPCQCKISSSKNHKVFPSYDILVVRGKWLTLTKRLECLTLRWLALNLKLSNISPTWYCIFNGMKIYLHVISQQSWVNTKTGPFFSLLHKCPHHVPPPLLVVAWFHGGPECSSCRGFYSQPCQASSARENWYGELTSSVRRISDPDTSVKISFLSWRKFWSARELQAGFEYSWQRPGELCKALLPST